MCCSKLNYIHDDVILLLVIMMYISNGKDGDIREDDDGNDVFHGGCNEDNDGYDIFLIYF